MIPATVSARAAARRRAAGAFGPRFFLGLALGFIWLGPAWWELRFAYAMVGWDALVLAAWFVDYRRLPRPAALVVTRRWLGPASLGVRMGVQVEIENRTGVALEMVSYDEVPPALRLEPPRLEAHLPQLGQARMGYEVRPTERGDLRVGSVFLRYRSALRLAERWAAANLGQTVRVYPNLQEPQLHTLYLIRGRQIELEKRFKRQRGRGREFESLREYREGDEPRDICWTASARRARLITRVYHTERSQALLIVVDAGRLMLARIGSEAGAPTKLDAAVNSAVTLAQVALHSGDRVGLVAYGRKPQAQLAAARGAAHLRAMLDRLALVRGELLEAGHDAAADLVLSLHNQRSLVVWMTDLAETVVTPPVVEAATRLAQRHLVLFAALGQPQLEELVASQPESHEQMYRYVAGLELVHRRELLLSRLREQGVLALELLPGKLATGLVNEYLKVKEQGLL